jgi:hypothetical protein
VGWVPLFLKILLFYTVGEKDESAWKNR